jgi:hypothetical protein
MQTKPMTRAGKLAAYFLMRPNEWVSAFTVRDRFAPLSRTQEISRVRQQFGMHIEFERRGKKRGYVYRPAKKTAAA